MEDEGVRERARKEAGNRDAAPRIYIKFVHRQGKIFFFL